MAAKLRRSLAILASVVVTLLLAIITAFLRLPQRLQMQRLRMVNKLHMKSLNS